jgi:hypothetical protein
MIDTLIYLLAAYGAFALACVVWFAWRYEVTSFTWRGPDDAEEPGGDA